MSDNINNTREQHQTGDGFYIQSVFYEKIEPAQEILNANQLDSHFVCCNRKISYKDTLSENYVLIDAIINDSMILIPATLIGIDESICCGLNDNDSHEIHYMDMFTNTMSSIDVENTYGMVYNEEISKQEQKEQIEKHISTRMSLADTLGGSNRNKILYNNAPEFIARICTALELKDVYSDLTKLQHAETIEVIRKKWLIKINDHAEQASHTLNKEKLQAELEDDQTTIEEIDIILAMLDDLPLESKVVLNQFHDCTQIFSYWPSLLLPGPDYLIPKDSYERYLLTGEYF